jgi:hypothetical protein
MAEEKRDESQRDGRANAPSGKDQTGDPGRTPGTAEGDRETVEEDLENKEGK